MVFWLFAFLRVSGTFRVPTAIVRRAREVRRPLSLEHPYYPARGERGIELLPKDRYLAEVETLLHEVTRKN